MFFNTYRKIATALLIATLVSLTVPPAAQARSIGRRSIDGSTREVTREARERGFFSLLLRMFDFAGGAMDPNGHS